MTQTTADTPRQIAISPVVAAASKASMSAQSKMLGATKFELSLVILAAAGGMLWSSIHASVFAGLSVFGFVGALIARGFVAQTRPERQWYDGRAAAESCKTLAWRYAVGGRPFGIGAAGTDEADKGLVGAIHDVISALTYLSPDEDSGPQITHDMRRLRAQSLRERRQVYEDSRVADQQRWYAAKAQLNERRSGQWQIAILGLELTGLIAGLAVLLGWIEVDLLGLIAASVAVVGAWLQLKQHENLARAYSVTAEELGAIRSLVGNQETDERWADFVDQSEEAISREHTLWRASRGVTIPTGLPRRRES